MTMKKTLFLIMLLAIACINSLYSQMVLPIAFDSSNIANYDELVNECIEPLDKSLISSGILGEKGFLFVDLDRFNGQTDSVITTPQWWQLYRQLHFASLSQTSMSSPDSIKTMSDQLLRQEIIPIALMNLNYNQIKPYALDNNLLVLSNGKLYDVLNRNESPYNNKHMFAAAVLKKRICHGLVTFRLDERFFINNVSSSIASLEIDFDDGQGYRSFSQNGFSNNDITISYQDPGEKTLTVRIVFSDQTILRSKTSFTIATTSNVIPDDSISITSYTRYLGDMATGVAYILYGCGNHGKLRKPFIVCDGFDPSNSRHFPELYEMLDGKDENGQSLKFIDKARAEGFDIIILDYDDGTDYIQRNAMVMVSLINYVNAQLRNNESNSQLVVIGPSMGGLIIRYALSYMEQNGMNHNTRLYVSFDSPHLGANIPIGDQYFVKYSTTLPFQDESNLEALNSPAARQMLIYHHESSRIHTDLYGSYLYVYPDRLRDELSYDPYFSFPTQCRKIAIANGSGEGITCLEPGVHMLSFNLFVISADVYAIGRDDKMVFKYWYKDGLFTSTTCYVTVYGTKLYDGAPGGTWELNKKIAEKNIFIKKKADPVCFIPVISSLALNTNDVNYRVRSIPGYPYPSSNITPFDAIYAPVNNQDHVTVTNENIGWIMNEIGAFDLYLQKQTVNKATDFEARNSITTGRNVVSYIPEGDFIVQNGSDEVLLRSQDIIQLKDGTHLRPWGTGTVRVCVSNFLCESLFVLPQNPSRGNTDGGEIETEHQTYTEIHESIASTSSEKLPRSYPNPCSDYTIIEYELEKNAKVEIDVYNLMGVKMFTVEDRQNMGAGRYTTTVNTSSLPTGMYIGIVRANGETNGVLKMQVMK